MSFSLDDSQRIKAMEENGIEYSIAYDEDGFVSTLSQDEISVAFTRDRMGRVTSVLYPDGDVSRYRYDNLGNRDLLNYSTGASMNIEHDGRGNIVTVNEVTSGGIEFTQSYQIDQYNRITRVEFLDSTPLNVSYDILGRPEWFNVGETIVGVEYLGDGEPIRLRSGQSTYALNTIQDDSVLSSVLPAPRAFLHNDRRSQNQPEYGTVTIQPYTLEAVIVPPEFTSVPGYLTVASALLTTKSWLTPENRSINEKPSNPIFQPPEYESTNCCLDCDWDSTCGQICTTIYGTGELTCFCDVFGYLFNNLGTSGGGSSSCSPSNASNKATAKQTVTSSLKNAAYAPNEEIFRVDCPSPTQIAHQDKGPTYDMCPPGFDGLKNKTIYLGHTHPKFSLKTDRGARVRCGDEYILDIRSDSDVNTLNGQNEKCSKQDNKTGNKYPLLLRTPSGSIFNCGSKS